MITINALLALCHAAAAPAALPWELPLLLFAAGFLGSFIHCVPMCGAFVLAQAGDCMACLPVNRMNERRRLVSGALPYYHCGRIGTYAALGAMAEVSLRIFARHDWLPLASGFLMIAASLLMMSQALQRWFPRPAMPGIRLWWRAIGPLSRAVRGHSRWRQFATGLVLGFLPCGMLGTALLAAAASGHPALAALAMAGFGLGTAPVLAALGIAGGRGLALWCKPAVPVLMLMSALVLAAIGGGELKP